MIRAPAQGATQAQIVLEGPFCISIRAPVQGAMCNPDYDFSPLFAFRFTHPCGRDYLRVTGQLGVF